MSKRISLSDLPDADLLWEVKRLAGSERHATACLIAALAEVDARRLYLSQGCSSLFTYCTQVLHLSEHAAYGRIEAARAARRFPVILDRLEDGSLNLTAVTLLAPHLTPDNCLDVLDAACHKSRREIEHQVVRLRPQPAVPGTVRKLPVPRPPEAIVQDTSSSPPAGGLLLSVPPPRPAVVTPLAPERYKLQCTLDAEAHAKLRRAQDLLRHTIPSGDVAAIVDRALTALLTELCRHKLAETSRPRASRPSSNASRHIPAAVRRAVWKRDGGRCAFVGPEGRCSETGLLEFHHVVPFAAGGMSTVANLQIRCKSHNAYEADQYYGSDVRRRRRGSPIAFPATRFEPS
jgi:hypothetical protein